MENYVNGWEKRKMLFFQDKLKDKVVVASLFNEVNF